MPENGWLFIEGIPYLLQDVQLAQHASVEAPERIREAWGRICKESRELRPEEFNQMVERRIAIMGMTLNAPWKQTLEEVIANAKSN
jgi:hypothetical protein